VAEEAVDARIVYWGSAGAGVSQSLRAIRGKLRGGGELREVPTRLDPTVCYELLPISLGKVGGVPTELQVIAVPSAPEQATTRKQLLDRVDGLVFVADASPERVEENVAAMEELRASLAAYGRDTGNLPIVIQYNKRDLSDPYAIEELHRRLGIADAAVFEAVATEATGVLQALTTVTKQVIRLRRDRVARAPAAETAAIAEPTAPAMAEPEEAPPRELAPTPELTPEPEMPGPSDSALLESAILAEGEDGGQAGAAEQTVRAAEALFDRPYDELAEEVKQEGGARIGPDFQIVSVGDATCSGPRSVRVKLVLGNPEGESVSLALGISLDPLLTADEE
jgi:hypothetical protein